MKFPMRVSGRAKATVAVKHYIGSKELAEMLVAFCGVGYGFTGPDIANDEDQGEDIRSRAVLDKAIREISRHWGLNGYDGSQTWHENFTEDEQERVAVWAARQIRRLYPELDDPALAEWLAEFAGPNRPLRKCPSCAVDLDWTDDRTGTCPECGDEFTEDQLNV